MKSHDEVFAEITVKFFGDKVCRIRFVFLRRER